MPEGSFDEEGRLEQFTRLSRDMQVSVVGTENYGDFNILYVLKDGQKIPAGLLIETNPNPEKGLRNRHRELNVLHNVSPNDNPTYAITKECAEIFRPVSVSDKVDLICISSSVDYFEQEAMRQVLLERNRENIAEGTLIVQAVANNPQGTRILQLPELIEVGKRVDGYVVHQYSTD